MKVIFFGNGSYTFFLRTHAHPPATPEARQATAAGPEPVRGEGLVVCAETTCERRGEPAIPMEFEGVFLGISKGSAGGGGDHGRDGRTGV